MIDTRDGVIEDLGLLQDLEKGFVKGNMSAPRGKHPQRCRQSFKRPQPVDQLQIPMFVQQRMVGLAAKMGPKEMAAAGGVLR